MKRLLLTGIGGFIGIHTLDHLLMSTDWEIIGIDSFRHKGLTNRITASEHYQKNKERVKIFTHDLIAPISTLLIDQIGPIDYIINMASDSHIDRSIEHPAPFIRNNVSLVTNILEYARIVDPKIFIQISTDEVPGPMIDEIAHKEWAVALPSNPYSASKAAQECIAISYWRTYGIPIVITRTMNNFGEYQDPEKYIPKCIKNVIQGLTVEVHGTEEEIGSRFWLHARNHASALLWIINNTICSKFPESDRPDMYNIVGDSRLNNLEMALHISDVLEIPLIYKLIDFHSSRPGHDPHYGLDGNKLKNLGWNPPIDFKDSLRKSIRWYLNHTEWLNL